MRDTYLASHTQVDNMCRCLLLIRLSTFLFLNNYYQRMVHQTEYWIRLNLIWVNWKKVPDENENVDEHSSGRLWKDKQTDHLEKGSGAGWGGEKPPPHPPLLPYSKTKTPSLRWGALFREGSGGLCILELFGPRPSIRSSRAFYNTNSIWMKPWIRKEKKNSNFRSWRYKHRTSWPRFSQADNTGGYGCLPYILFY